LTFIAEISELAQLDIKEAVAWYNKEQQGLGKRFSMHVRQKIKSVCRNPYGYRLGYKHVRLAVVDIFPYMIHYTIEKDRGIIHIIAVISTHRNPKNWENR